MNSLTKSDKAWINGYFTGFYSGQEQILIENISYLKKKLKQIRKAIRNEFEAKNA